ncbi:signal transduction histidine kinase [Paenibacillus endophyticus]|uniref:histidine kinase n=1 Tax=Paenibacillus endophyticus TaxID=1294268 RepID=A0A7W5GAI6_9BACL|nr:HAMP domain-containing sensor histidine kinase [Paenibacillus endophyticus]MBB3152378.1 signal transduction histidine kinase [Paenibacillus endophyticus]
MKALHRWIAFLMIAVLALSFFWVATSKVQAYTKLNSIPQWELMWDEDSAPAIEEANGVFAAGEWQSFTFDDALPDKPAHIRAAWLRFKLPDYDLSRPAVLITKLTAKDVMIFMDQKVVYESSRNYPFNKNEILLSLSESESGQFVYLFVQTDSDWLGLKEQPKVGEGQALNKDFLKKEVYDVILGSILLFVSLALLLCFIFLNRTYLAGLVSLSFFILSISLMILSLSPYLHTMYSQYGRVMYYLFDIGSNLLMPSLFFFFERIFGKGPWKIITRFRKLQVIVSIITIIWLLLSFSSSEISSAYTSATIITFGGTIIIGNGLLLILLIRFCFQKNKNAIIMATGFGIFAAIGVMEVIWYFISEMNYEMFFWKWGILTFLVSLLFILARRIIESYDQVLKYSRQLEVFNNELQRSEKMEIISQLAASVAHEVRNPLQVTRGFLQVLGESTRNEKEKGFMALAIEELDRASEIITDFLMFAKPELDQMTTLNVAEEILKIEAILVPLANMQGSIIQVESASDLYVNGNSSKLKQALINIIKNSIESLNKGGTIVIQAYLKDDRHVIICIKDNGEGMNELELKKLGEPYYSKKTKGTGLGLMVTFRIIEVMKGSIFFTSEKGVGTEATIQFPMVKK